MAAQQGSSSNSANLQENPSSTSTAVKYRDALEEFRRRNSRILSAMKCASIEVPGPSSAVDETLTDSLPLEYHMGVPPDVRAERFASLVEPGDVVEGHVTRKAPLAVEGTVDRFVDPPKHRYVQDLDLRCVLKITDLARTHSDQELAYSDFRCGDVFRAVVKELDRGSGVLYVSLREDQLNRPLVHAQLGYVERLRPPSPNPPPRDRDFVHCLQRDAAFHNPACVRNLAGILGIDCHSRKSLYTSSGGPPYPPSEYADSLKKAQRKRYSTEFAVTGVSSMKQGKEKQAKKCFDQALDVDPSNVEALVARGALFANQKQFVDAEGDFTAALKIQPEHKNAKLYLASTHTAYAKDLEKDGKVVSALKHYQAALATDPAHPEHIIAQDRLATLRGILNQQIEEEERKAREEEMLKKALDQIMHKKGSKKDKHKSGKSSKKKKKKKEKRKKHNVEDEPSRRTSSEELSDKGKRKKAGKREVSRSRDRYNSDNGSSDCGSGGSRSCASDSSPSSWCSSDSQSSARHRPRKRSYKS